MNRNKVKIFINPMAVSEKLSSWQQAIKIMNDCFFSFQVLIWGQWLVGSSRVKGTIIFFPYGQNHDSS